jgi:hypothetical protein
MGLRRTILRPLIKNYYQRKAVKYAGLRSPWRIKNRRNAYGDVIEDAIDLAPKFDEAQWESGVRDILDWAEGQAGNAGQITLINDYLSPKVIQYCAEIEEDFDPEEFVNLMQEELGDTYYYAINEIIDEMSLMLDQLRDACHQSFLENAAWRLGVGFGSMFMSTPNRQYPSMAHAFAAYQTARLKNGYRTTDTPAGRAFNSERNRQSFIKRYGPGPTKPWKSASGMEMMPGYAAYQQAAARNGRIIKP